jgi:hypothetical protein
MVFIKLAILYLTKLPHYQDRLLQGSAIKKLNALRGEGGHISRDIQDNIYITGCLFVKLLKFLDE